MDLTDIITEYGAYYGGNAENRQRLRSKLYNAGGKWDDRFTRIPTESDKEEWTHTENSEVLQPYQHAWTPKGDLSATPYTYPLFWAKLDIEEVPDKLVKTWLGFLSDSKENDRTKWPFVRWYIENHLLPAMQQDRYLEWGYKGVFVTPTAGTASPAHETGDGFRKVIRDLVGTGHISPWVGGTFPTVAADMVTYIENMVKALPEQFRERPMDLEMRTTNVDLFAEGKRVKYNLYTKQEDELTVHNHPNIRIVGYGNMGTSDLVTISNKSNRLLFQKGAVKKNILRVETLKRTLFLFSDFHEGYGVDKPSEFFLNDQDLS